MVLEARSIARCQWRRALSACARRPSGHFRQWSSAMPACSTSAAATGRCCASSPRRARGRRTRYRACRKKGVNDCVAKGLSVIQGDADIDLADYPDDGFDYVILSQTLQATRNPRAVARAHAADRPLRDRFVPGISAIGGSGFASRSPGGCRLPKNLPLFLVRHMPNIHLCTIRDFTSSLDEMGAKIEKALALDRFGAPIRFNAPWWVWNLLGEQAVFLLTRRE